ESALDATSQSFLSRINVSFQKMGKLLDDLLAFSKMGLDEMSSSTVDLEILLEESLAHFEPETRERNFVWRRAPLPAVLGDAAMLRQVLINVLSNALKYTLRRDPAEIEIGHFRQEEIVVIFIRDNGAGFDMEHYEKIFRVFHRLHHDAEFEGT